MVLSISVAMIFTSYEHSNTSSITQGLVQWSFLETWQQIVKSTPQLIRHGPSGLVDSSSIAMSRFPTCWCLAWVKQSGGQHAGYIWSLFGPQSTPSAKTPYMHKVYSCSLPDLLISDMLLWLHSRTIGCCKPHIAAQACKHCPRPHFDSLVQPHILGSMTFVIPRNKLTVTSPVAQTMCCRANYHI